MAGRGFSDLLENGAPAFASQVPISGHCRMG
jgi:hypothetical protein